MGSANNPTPPRLHQPFQPGHSATAATSARPQPDSDGPPCCRTAARPGPAHHTQGGRLGPTGGRASAESPLGRRPPGAGVVTGGGVRVVGDTGTVAVVGGGDEGVVTFGATVVFLAAVITQSAARQPTAKSSGRESPDIAASALALERKLGHPALPASLRPLQRRLRDSAPPAGSRRRHMRAACEGGAPAIPSGILWEEGDGGTERKPRKGFLSGDCIGQSKQLARYRKLFSLPSGCHTGRGRAFLVPAIEKDPPSTQMEQPT